MKLLMILSLMLFTVACTSELEVQTKPTQIKWTQPADPAPVKLEKPTWRIITEQNAQQALAEISKENNGKFTVIVLSTQDYQKLMVDLADIKRYIEQQKAVIVYYKNITTN